MEIVVWRRNCQNLNIWTPGLHDNIERFGGDPENVIVSGQSGGGAKVTTLLQTSAADGLYAKGINTVHRRRNLRL